jgi:nitroimidazol reductase NimA-like FMN-containing flavoprotein (pyridoxamine 5'-phosphate oxidase superfamily)
VCIYLLETQSLGRLPWQAADTQQLLPINYVFRSGVAYFRTSPHAILSELVRPDDVAFEVDDLDHHKRTGWSVIVYGRAKAVAAPVEVLLEQ